MFKLEKKKTSKYAYWFQPMLFSKQYILGLKTQLRHINWHQPHQKKSPNIMQISFSSEGDSCARVTYTCGIGGPVAPCTPGRMYRTAAGTLLSGPPVVMRGRCQSEVQGVNWGRNAEIHISRHRPTDGRTDTDGLNMSPPGWWWWFRALGRFSN